MEDSIQTQIKDEPAGQAAQRSYTQPQLVTYGDVAQLTQHFPEPGRKGSCINMRP
jgi:hypothetical protein